MTEVRALFSQEGPSLMAQPDHFKNSIVVSEVEYWATIGKLDLLRQALDRGESPNARDVDGYTALHGAAENGHVQVVTLLLERGAHVRALTRDGLTPLDLAEMSDQDAVALVLRQHGGD
jgi:ankyrin repeat protein